MRSVFENATHQIEHDAARQLVILRRTRTRLADVDRDRLLHEVTAALRPLHRQRLLVDIRLAPGDNDPAIEVSIKSFRAQLAAMFPVAASLVATAVGRLQLTRLSRERKDPDDGRGTIFMDEGEALAYLLAHPL